MYECAIKITRIIVCIPNTITHINVCLQNISDSEKH